MRHLKAGKRLGVTTSHRKALMRNLVTALLEHGEIKTTVTRAKEMRKYFDRMIGLGKRNDLHAKRQAMSFIKTKQAFKRLFEEYGPLYSERNGGYTRIYRIGRRLGDNAEMALIQMVDIREGAPTIEKKETRERITEIQDELKQSEKGKPDKSEVAESEEAQKKEETVTAEATQESEEVAETEKAQDAEEAAAEEAAEDSSSEEESTEGEKKKEE